MNFDFANEVAAMKTMLKTVVEMETPTENKPAIDELGKYFSGEIKNLGGSVEIVENKITGNILIGRFGEGAQTVLLMHHMDTVFPIGTLKKMPFYEKGDKIFGPGVLDMKGGIIISLAAIKRLISEKGLNKKVVLMITTDEEAGSETSQEVIEAEAKKADLALVLESGLVDGSLKTWRKGVGDFYITVKGRASHAGGAHSEGINAIEELAHQVVRIQKMTDYEKGTTLNVGVIRGGTVTNVIPDSASADIDFRVLIPEEADRIKSELAHLTPVLTGTTIEISGGLNRPPMPSDDTMKKTFAKADRIAQTIGQTLIAGGSGGGSDGNFLSPLGIPLLDGIGTYGEGLHSEREYIFTKSLPERAALVAALIYHW